jgi:hypothetical protein
MSPGWIAAQRREESLLSRPLKLAFAAAATVMLALVIAVAAGGLSALIAAPVIAVCVLIAGASGYAIWQGERALRRRIDAERRRVELFRADQARRLFAWQTEHARQVRDWQARRSAFDSQKRWYAVSLPAGFDRVDVVGGTLSGWSAMLTMAGGHRLAAGGEVTVIDISGGAVAADLVTVARACGIEPMVWVLPKDLPRLDLSAALDAGALADVLAQTASAGAERGSTGDLAVDHAILERIMGVLGASDPADGISMPRVAAGLRALAQVGDPRADVTDGLLTEAEATGISTLFGGGAADRVVLERALGMESQIRRLATAATGLVPLPRSRLRVVAMDKRAGVLPTKILGGFTVTALTHLLSQATPGRPWQHTLFLMGAQRLPDDVLDRLSDACEACRTGLVLGYRSIPAQVRQRLGRGNAAVAFMRLGNAADAKAASEQIGTEHRFLLSQLTETVGASVTDTTGASYTSTVGASASLARSTSASESASEGRGHGRSAESGFLPLAPATVSRSGESGTSRGTSESDSITAGISMSTAWGESLSRAAGESQALAHTLQRSREFLVEQHELQQLPPTAMIVSYATAAGRQVFMADVNPAIGSLPVATMTPLAEAGTVRAAVTARAAEQAADQPNLGPPAARLDWRKRSP